MEKDKDETEKTRPESLKTVILFTMFGFLSNFMLAITLSSAEDLLSGETSATGSVWFYPTAVSSILSQIVTSAFDRLPPLALILLLFPMNASAMACLFLAGKGVWLTNLCVCLIGATYALGNVTGISLTAYFDKITVTAFCSGTGIAYLIGPFYITAMTSWLHIHYKIAITAIAILQATMFLACYCLLEKRRENTRKGYRKVTEEPQNEEELLNEQKYLTLREKLRTLVDIFPDIFISSFGILSHDFILGGVTTTLAFSNSPISVTDQYKYYLLQSFIGLFVGRSYLGLADYIRPGLSNKILLRQTWLLGVLTASHLIVLILASLYRFLPNIWCVLVLVFSLGICGQATFVNTSLIMGEIEDKRKREFALGLTMYTANLGAMAGSGLSMPVEQLLVKHCVAYTNQTITCLTRA